MRNILLPLREDRGTESLLEMARRLIQLFEARVEARYPFFAGVPVAVDVAVAGWMPAELDRIETKAREEAETVGQRFLTHMRQAGVPVAAAPETLDKGPLAVWGGLADGGDSGLAAYARLFDLILCGRRIGPGEPMSQLETLLFESGRPLLIVPEHLPDKLFERVVIAWNGSSETARTIGLTMRLIKRAQKIFVLSVEGGMVSGPTGTQLADMLLRGGLDAEARHLRPEGRQTGEVFLEESRRLEADLLVKGAYTQSRLRQMIFGGATSYILHNAELPVLMAH